MLSNFKKSCQLKKKKNVEKTLYVYFENSLCCLSSLIPELLFTFCHFSLYIVPLTSLFIIVHMLHMLLLYLMYQYWSERIS